MENGMVHLSGKFVNQIVNHSDAKSINNAWGISEKRLVFILFIGYTISKHRFTRAKSFGSQNTRGRRPRGYPHRYSINRGEMKCQQVK